MSVFDAIDLDLAVFTGLALAMQTAHRSSNSRHQTMLRTR
jgi:hypothetical protein